jgi:hypothetical protein
VSTAPPDTSKPPGAPQNAPSVTTPEEDRTTAGQRRINFIWEFTQAAIAVSITATVCVVGAVRALVPVSAVIDNGASQILSNAFFLIVGFYFSRTNHTKTGGVGAVPGKER